MHHFIYFTASLIFSIGLYITLSSNNYLRKIIGLGVLQGSVLIFFIALGKISGGVAPIYQNIEKPMPTLYSSALPSVLMLTAIVVGFASLALGLAMLAQIQKKFGTIEADEIRDIMNNDHQ